MNEARRLLDKSCGRRSLPTVQALLILYTCCTGQGRDRGGLQYRLVAYEMLKRLQVRLEARYSRPGIADEASRHKYQKGISRALWGIFCFERYYHPPFVSPIEVGLTDAPLTAYLRPHTCSHLWSERRQSQDDSLTTGASIRRSRATGPRSRSLSCRHTF